MPELYTFAVYTADPEELDYYTVPVPDDVTAMDVEAWYENKYKERVHSFWKKRTAEETRQMVEEWRRKPGNIASYTKEKCVHDKDDDDAFAYYCEAQIADNCKVSWF